MAALALLGMVAGAVAFTANRGSTPSAAPSSTARLAPQPADCTDGAPGGELPGDGLDLGDVVVEGDGLPKGWARSDERLPQVTEAQLVSSASGDSSFGLVRLPDSAATDLEEAARSFLDCLPYLPRYSGDDPMPTAVADVSEDATGTGVDYLHVSARVNTGSGAQRGGDAVYLVAVGTSPITMAVGIAPLDDKKAQEQVREALSAVQIRTTQN